ncbi:hypothetical protein LSAT2_002168, partial [Lamellibrachia satsuma]
MIPCDSRHKLAVVLSRANQCNDLFREQALAFSNKPDGFSNNLGSLERNIRQCPGDVRSKFDSALANPFSSKASPEESWRVKLSRANDLSIQQL